jgi:uncharacterized Zn finger protein
MTPKPIYINCAKCRKKKVVISPEPGVFFRCTACGYQITVEKINYALNEGVSTFVKAVGEYCEVFRKLSKEAFENKVLRDLNEYLVKQKNLH